jgi:hypothetical protein
VIAELRRGQRRSEREIDDASRLWGLDAFAAGYARTRGLTLEDHNAFRRGFAAPLSGMPLRVWRGPLAQGVSGRLAFWIDRTDRSRPAYALVGIVAFAGEAAPVIDGYATALRDGVLVIWHPVPAQGRSAARLDALRTTLAVVADAAPALVRQ